MRTLVLDIETIPNQAHVWSIWNTNVEPLTQLRVPGRVIAVAAKWHGDKRVLFFSDYHNGHAEMVSSAHALLDQADAVVHYNGNTFDMPWLRTEFAQAGLRPPAPHRDIDLLRTVKKQFRFPSNKLAYVTRELGLSGKLSHTGHQMWVDIMEGDDETRRKAWNLMRRYNKQDVVTTEELYDKLLPWIQGHPNLGLYSGVADACPKCGSTDLEKRGFKATDLTIFQQYQCRSCGGWCRGKHAVGRAETR